MNADQRWCMCCGDVPAHEVIGHTLGDGGPVMAWQHTCGYAWPRYGAEVPAMHRCGMAFVAGLRVAQ